MRQRDREMLVRSIYRRRSLGNGQEICNAAQAPGAAEIDTVKVGDLPVASIADNRGLEQARGLPVSKARKEVGEPRRELGRMGPRHAKRLRQRRGEELVAPGLPGLAIPVRAEPVQ